MLYRYRAPAIIAIVLTTTLLLWTAYDDLDSLARRTASYTRNSLQTWIIDEPDIIVTDLLDPSVVLRTPGESLTDQQFKAFANISFTLPSHSLQAGKSFNLTVQCDSSIIGNNQCATMYQVHFRGPIAHTLPPIPEMYIHDAETGTTIIECNVPQEGSYEVWIWPDWPRINGCEKQPSEGPFPAVRGSGETGTMIGVGGGGVGGHEEVDGMRICGLMDYETEMKGRWVSVGHIREEYRVGVLKAHLERSVRMHGHTTMPDYIFLPYQCKRAPLDYATAVESTKDMTHVAYLGDSILRSTYCGHLYNSLHNGTVDGDCAFSEDWGRYQKSDKTFTLDSSSLSSPVPPPPTPITSDDVSSPFIPPSSPGADHRAQLRFTQRFIDDHPEKMGERLTNILDYETPVSHIITNLGMWFGAHPEHEYIRKVYEHLENLYSIFGDKPRYTWVETYALSPPILCFGTMRRPIMRHHGEWAGAALHAFRERHPDVRINVVKSFPILDSRPETASDGRHWVREGGKPSLEVRPLVGAGDDAVMEAVYDYWRLAYEHDAAKRKA